MEIELDDQERRAVGRLLTERRGRRSFPQAGTCGSFRFYAARTAFQPFRRFAWVARTMTEGEQSPKPHGAGNGAARERRGGDHRREARDRDDDEALVAAMPATPGASIGDWAGKIGKSRTGVVTALHRLKDVGLAEIERRQMAAGRGAARVDEAAAEVG